jgi:threonine dehydratase
LSKGEAGVVTCSAGDGGQGCALWAKSR